MTSLRENYGPEKVTTCGSMHPCTPGFDVRLGGPCQRQRPELPSPPPAFPRKRLASCLSSVLGGLGRCCGPCSPPVPGAPELMLVTGAVCRPRGLEPFCTDLARSIKSRPSPRRVAPRCPLSSRLDN